MLVRRSLKLSHTQNTRWMLKVRLAQFHLFSLPQIQIQNFNLKQANSTFPKWDASSIKFYKHSWRNFFNSKTLPRDAEWDKKFLLDILLAWSKRRRQRRMTLPYVHNFHHYSTKFLHELSQHSNCLQHRSKIFLSSRFNAICMHFNMNSKCGILCRKFKFSR